MSQSIGGERDVARQTNELRIVTNQLAFADDLVTTKESRRGKDHTRRT